MKRIKARERGVALITALLMTVVFLVLIGGLMSQMIGEIDSVGAHSRSAEALNAAYAGVEDMVLSIEENASGPGHGTPGGINYSYPAPSTVSYSSSVINTWNSSSGLVYYEIDSKGTETVSGQTREIVALVRSFPYSYYEQFTAGNSGSVYYVTGENFDGPVYNGGSMNIWYDDPGAAIFNSSVETVSTPSFYEGAGKTSVAESSVNWADVTGTQGQNALTVGTNPMQLPTFQTNLADASEAFYGNPNETSGLPAPPANGIYINGNPAMAGPAGALTTGIYMQGDVTITPCSGTCGSYSGDNEVFTVKSAGTADPLGANYTIAINFTTNSTTVTQTSGCSSGCTITYSGVPSGQPSEGATAANGAIFVNGNVTIDSGTIHGDYSLAVPDYDGDSDHTITLAGAAPGIEYLDESSTSTDEFGVWANDITVNSTTTTGYEFDGSILTGYYGECPPCTDGTFSNKNWDGAAQGTFTFHGGLVQNIDGAMGTSSDGTLETGFERAYEYDPRLAANPPPGFPITNRYDIVAWTDVGQ
ncbi:MAG TPA: hypothetical protein VEJ41_08025 [Candidatus Acidoferrales bacterium]|nr:hypothetical protein [Candidatus Acidoferrales bacterium]